MQKNRMAGHGLDREGAAYHSPGAPARDPSGPGMALCECSVYSPVLENRARRKRWHRDHKDEIREAAADGSEKS